MGDLGKHGSSASGLMEKEQGDDRKDYNKDEELNDVGSSDGLDASPGGVAGK